MFTVIERVILEDNPVGRIAQPHWCFFFLSSIPGFASPGPNHASLTITAGSLATCQDIAPSPHKEMWLGLCLRPSPPPWSRFEWSKWSLATAASRSTWILKLLGSLQIWLLVGTPESVSSLGSCACCRTEPGKGPPLPPVHAAQGSCPHSTGVLSPTSTSFFHLCRLYHLPHPTSYGQLFEFNTFMPSHLAVKLRQSIKRDSQSLGRKDCNITSVLEKYHA